MAFQNNKLPIHIVTGEVKSTSGGFSAVETALGIYKNVPSAAGQTNINDKVEVIFGDPQNRRLPVIVSNRSVKQSETMAGAVENFPPIPISPDIWSQHMGYWFNPSRSNSPQKVFGMQDPVSTQILNETLTWEQIGPDVFIHFSQIVSFSLAFNIEVDTTPTWVGPPGPFGVWIETIGPRNDLGIPNDHSFFLLSNTTYTTEVVTADYYYANLGAGDTSNFINTGNFVGGGSDALGSALQFRGIVLFPQAASEQIVSILSANYSANGGVTQTSFYQDNIYIGVPEEGQFVNTTHLPNALPNIYSSPLPIYQMQGGTILFELTPGTYGLSVFPLDTCDLWLLYKDNYDSNYFEQFTGDGVQTVFEIAGGPISYYTPGGNVDGPGAVIEIVTDIQVNGISQTPLDYSIFEGTITFVNPPGNGETIDCYLEVYSVVNTVVENPPAFDFTYVIAQAGAFKALYLECQSVDCTSYIYIDWNTATLMYLYPFVDGDQITLEYNYTENIGAAYDIDGLKIIEKNAQTNVQTILNTNLSAYPANPIIVSAGQASRQYYPSYQPTRGAGQLFYDVETDSYTIAGPTGLIWRSRTPSEQPAPAQAVPAVHSTHTPWSSDGTSADKQIVEDLALSVPRRAMPWLGFSAAGPYGLQGSWARVGGYRGDTDFLIRFWKRNPTTFIWEEVATRSVTTICGTPDNSYPVRVCAQGVTGLENLVLPSAPGMNTTWPCLRNYEGWVVAASWIVHNYANDFAPNPVATPSEFGWKDAGLTINVLSPITGAIKASITFKCDKDLVIDEYVDRRTQVNNDLASATAFNNAVIDKYANGNMAYWPPLSGLDPAPPWLGQISWIGVSDFFADPPAGQTWFINAWLRNLLADNPGTRGYPGAPSIQGIGEGNAPLGIFWTNDSTNENTPENRQLPCNIVIDDDNFIYITVAFPTWKRLQDILNTQQSQQPTRIVTRTTVYNYAGGIYNNSNLFVDIPLGGLATSIQGTFAYGGPFPMFHPSVYTGIASLFNVLRFYPNVTFIGNDPNPPYSPQFQYDPTTVTINWSEWQINPGHTATPYSMLFCAEFPTFIGFQCSPMPYLGFKTIDFDSDTIQQYIGTFRRLFLMKLRYSDNAITEVWRKDVTEYGTPRFPPQVPALNQNVPSDSGSVPYTLAIGRFIFILRFEGREDLADVSPPNVVLKNYVEAYLNGATEPGPPVHRTDIGTFLTTDKMTVDIDSTGREHVTISGTTKQTTIVYNLTLATPPTVTNKATGNVSGEPVIPQSSANAERMARGSDSYYWDDYSNNIKRREML